MPVCCVHVLLAGTVGLLFLASLAVGPSAISSWLALGELVRGGDTIAAVILVEIRLPRALLGVMVGGVLGLAGAVLQGLFRNPLAEPGVIGLSSCAALGAVIVFYSGAAMVVPLALPLGGLAGGVVGVAALMGLAARDGGMTRLILAGVALGSLANALTTLALSLSPNPYALHEVVFWLLGSLADRSLTEVGLALPFAAVGAGLLLRLGPALDALTLGEETAVSLGIDLRSVRRRAILGAGAAVGAMVAVSGVIGFVGLIVPHALRAVVSHQPSRLLPASGLGGMVLVLAADLAVRLVGSTQELKIGVLTALLGAPVLLFLVLGGRGRGIDP